jgi:hypothetical protein
MTLDQISFHDSSIGSFTIDYINSEITFDLIESESLNKYRVIVKPFKNFSITNNIPWGASASINELTVNETINIQLQSGDEIKIEAESYNVEKLNI